MNLKRIILFLLFIFFSSSSLFSQPAISLIAKVGQFQEHHRLHFDNGGALFGGWMGFDGEKIYTTGIQLLHNKNINSELSFSYHKYNTFINHNDPYLGGVYMISNAVEIFKFNSLIGYQLNLWKKRILITPRVGLGFSLDTQPFGINSLQSGYWTKRETDGSFTEYFRFDARINHTNKINLYAISSLEFSFKLIFNSYFFLSTDYHQGLLKVLETDIIYTLEDKSQIFEAQYFTRTSHFGLNAGLKIPLNWIWGKKEKVE